MKKFTRILQVLMIMLLSVSVLYAQNYSNKINNAQSEKEIQLNKLSKKQAYEEKVLTTPIPDLSEYYVDQNANTSAYQDGEKKTSPQQQANAVPYVYHGIGNTSQYEYIPKADPIIYNPKDYPAPTDQGGEDIATAVVIPSIPYAATGTIVGFIDDYEEVCPYASTSPDVVYSYTPAADVTVDISLCNDLTDYDTKLFVYENAATPGLPYACNDDACATLAYPSAYVSELLGVFLTGGNTYYIVVDGYGGASGFYDLTVGEYVPPPDCVWGVDIVCPPGASDEGEPCGDDTNGGCNTDPVNPPFTTIASTGETFCGTTWASGATRDTDWYELTITTPSTVTMTADADQLIIYGIIADATGNYSNLDCTTASQIAPNNTAGPCNETSLLIGDLAPGNYWFFVGMTVYEGFPCDNNYWVTWDVQEVLCAAPSPTSTSDRALTGARANWTELNGAVSAEVCWGLTGTIDPDVPATYLGSALKDQSFGGPGFFYDITGLTAATAYTWYVRSLCPDLDAPSDWSVANNFMTYCVTCPPGSTLEGEGVIADDTFDVTNGGCNATPNIFSAVSCGETVCGSTGFYFSGALNYRDTDWYELVIPAGVNQTVTVEFMANYSIQGLILAPPCGATTTLANYVAVACELGVMTAANLAPGTYYVWMGADFTGGDADWSEYYFTVTCADVLPGTGCENTTLYPSTTTIVDPAGALTAISGCNFAGEYSVVTGIVSGDTYEFTLEDLGTGAYITITDGAPTGANILAYGPSPLQWTATSAGDLYAHWSLDEYCTADAVCHDTWVQCLTCLSYDLDGTVNYFGDTFPMDYIDVTLDDGSDVIIATTMTNGGGNYLFTGLAPGIYTLGATTTKPRGGTGLADYGLIVSHLLGSQLVGLPYLSADVDNSGDIGLADYGLIVSSLLGNTAYLNPDWIFGENLVVNIPSKQTQDFHAISSGDPDGSYIVPPAGPGEVCQTAVPIDISTLPTPVVVLGNNDGGITFSSLPFCITSVSGPGVWYSFIGTGVEVLIETCATVGFSDSKLHVYTGTCDAMVCEVGNDDYCSFLSGVQFTTVMGVEYYVLVSGYSATNFGDFVLTINEVLPCIVPCPPGSTDEGEGVIPDDTNDVTNGGCNSDPNVFGSVVCGETVCGTAGFYLTGGSNFRDTDWYELVIPAGPDQNVTVEFEAEFLIQGYILSGGCAAIVLEAGYLAQPCEIGTMTAFNLAPGTYMIFMGPDFAATANWDEYWFTVTCEDATAVIGCEHSALYPSTAVTLDGTSTLTTISTCNYAGEYSIVNGFVIGQTYEFTMTDLGTGAFITLRDGVPAAGWLAEGVSPLIWVATQTDITVHWSVDALCTALSSCHTTTVQCTTCP